MRPAFYDLIKYQEKQSKIAKTAWRKGFYDHLLAKVEERKCKRINCNKSFKVKYYDPKQFCSRNCSASHNNYIRGPMSQETKFKISESIKKSPYHNNNRGKILVPRLVKNCLNCRKKFNTPKWQNHKYCSVSCSIHDIGQRPTSPKAARAKAGIRPDIDPNMYFFSRWEANYARVLNFLNIKWQFQPRSFSLKTQKYTPDFYLPNEGAYIEIKNFLSSYSANRDKEFRELYPDIKLILILKSDYLDLQDKFSPVIKNWEFS